MTRNFFGGIKERVVNGGEGLESMKEVEKKKIKLQLFWIGFQIINWVYFIKADQIQIQILLYVRDDHMV